MKLRIFLLAAAITALAAVPAGADQFGILSTLGDIGSTHTFVAGSLDLRLLGFDAGVATDMNVKNQGPTEFGLGLVKGLNQEISGPFDVQLDFTEIEGKNPSSISIGINSIQFPPDTYSVWGSNADDVLGVLLASGQQGGTFDLTPWDHTFTHFTVTSPLGTVLLDNVSVQTPESSTLVLLLAGLAGIALFTSRRGVKQAAA